MMRYNSERHRRGSAIHGEIELDAWVVVLNHFHEIVVYANPVGAVRVGAVREPPLRMTVQQRRNMALPKLIGRFKMLSAKRINQSRRIPGAPVWQRNYFEHIICHESSLHRVREYIATNPARREEDSKNPAAVGRSA